jgi:hypothetical protein
MIINNLEEWHLTVRRLISDDIDKIMVVVGVSAKQ